MSVRAMGKRGLRDLHEIVCSLIALHQGKGAGAKVNGRQPHSPHNLRPPITGKGALAPKDEGSVTMVAVASAFPAHQRVYILFLQAADSDRLNTHVGR